jgi:hypothetical protein
MRSLQQLVATHGNAFGLFSRLPRYSDLPLNLTRRDLCATSRLGKAART